MSIRLPKSLIIPALFITISLHAAEQPQNQSPPAPETRLTTPPQTGPSGIIATIAGNGYIGEGGDGGPAIDSELLYPSAVAVDSAGNVYIAEQWGQAVRKITASTGIITTYAGNGQGGYSGDNGPATKAEMNAPYGLAVDAHGNLYIADTGNDVIREVNAKTGIITTIAGNGFHPIEPEIASFCGVITNGVKATKASLCSPKGLAVDGAGNLYIADEENNMIRKVAATTGIITTVAGSGLFDYAGDGGLAVNAGLAYPSGVAVDRSGNLYIADTNSCAIRKVSEQTGIITSIVGTINGHPGGCGLAGDGGPVSDASINAPLAVVVDSTGNVFIADTSDFAIRMVDASNGYIYTVAGRDFLVNPHGNLETSTPGYSGDGGPATFAELSMPESLAIGPSGTLYFADTLNYAVRAVTEPGAPPAETPTASYPTGAFKPPLAVTLTAPVEGSTIYYTINGSVPSTSSTKYTGPIAVPHNESIIAFAAVAGQLNSQAAIFSYFRESVPTFKPGSEVITAPTAITISEGSQPAAIYYTTDGSDPAASYSAQLYTGPVTVPVGTTLAAAAWEYVEDYKTYMDGVWTPVAVAYYTKTAKPQITTQAATGIYATSAQLNGTVIANSAQAQFWAIYGTSGSSMSNKTGEATAYGTIPLQTNFGATSLKPKTKYYFQFVATNPSGTTKGAILSFTTPAN